MDLVEGRCKDFSATGMWDPLIGLFSVQHFLDFFSEEVKQKHQEKNDYVIGTAIYWIFISLVSKAISHLPMHPQRETKLTEQMCKNANQQEWVCPFYSSSSRDGFSLLKGGLISPHVSWAKVKRIKKLKIDYWKLQPTNNWKRTSDKKRLKRLCMITRCWTRMLWKPRATTKLKQL